MRVAGLVVFCVALVLSGCVGNDRFDGTRPDDWQAGAPLLAFEGGKSHDADETYSLRLANASDAPAQPVRCIAYQDGRHAVGDECAVVPAGRTTWEGTAIEGWTLDASWDGRGQDLHEDVELNRGGRTVVAFAEDGSIVAHWDGMAMDPNGSFSTE
ncbi:MAG TPA: hypothetical protein VJ874_05145 [Candidatus Thermoplasmatota archaeon]|nr:hypothetical protein [Candidatus Thermoplasmatota archaeon]